MHSVIGQPTSKGFKGRWQKVVVTVCLSWSSFKTLCLSVKRQEYNVAGSLFTVGLRYYLWQTVNVTFPYIYFAVITDVDCSAADGRPPSKHSLHRVVSTILFWQCAQLQSKPGKGTHVNTYKMCVFFTCTCIIFSYILHYLSELEMWFVVCIYYDIVWVK